VLHHNRKACISFWQTKDIQLHYEVFRSLNLYSIWYFFIFKTIPWWTKRGSFCRQYSTLWGPLLPFWVQVIRIRCSGPSRLGSLPDTSEGSVEFWSHLLLWLWLQMLLPLQPQFYSTSQRSFLLDWLCCFYQRLAFRISQAKVQLVSIFVNNSALKPR